MNQEQKLNRIVELYNMRKRINEEIGTILGTIGGGQEVVKKAPQKRRKHLTTEERNNLLQRYRNGEKVKDLARDFGIKNYNSIYSMLKRYDKPVQKQTPDVESDMDEVHDIVSGI